MDLMPPEDRNATHRPLFFSSHSSHWTISASQPFSVLVERSCVAMMRGARQKRLLDGVFIAHALVSLILGTAAVVAPYLFKSIVALAPQVHHVPTLRVMRLQVGIGSSTRAKGWAPRRTWLPACHLRYSKFQDEPCSKQRMHVGAFGSNNFAAAVAVISARISAATAII